MSKKSWLFSRPLVGMAFCLYLLGSAGCGRLPTGSISGKVVYQGKPLNGGVVTFIPEKGNPAFSQIQADGSYNIASIPAGPAKISVQVPETDVQPIVSRFLKSKKEMPQDMPEELKAKMSPSKTYRQIPKQYADQDKSGLTYEVKAGSQSYDIQLK